MLTDPPDRTHISLLYDNEDNLYSTIAAYLNEGLARGQLCVYASVHIRDEAHLEKISPLIRDYDANVEKGNLLVVDLAPHYISSMLGDMRPFEAAKKLFAEKAKHRADKHVRFVGDGTGFLFQNGHYDECAMIEEWWQQKPFEGSYVCPVSKSLLYKHPHDAHARRAIISTHDIIIDSNESASSQKESKSNGGGKQ